MKAKGRTIACFYVEAISFDSELLTQLLLGIDFANSAFMIQGSCLCGGVKIEVKKVIAPFELCHCNRCRSVSGSAFLAAVNVRQEDFKFLQGQELVQIYEAPVVNEPPGYRSVFCRVCGCPVPDPNCRDEVFEIAAGIFPQTANLNIHPDKHIFVENKSSWYEIKDDLPQFTKQQLFDSAQPSTKLTQ